MAKIQGCTTINMIMTPALLVGGTGLFFFWRGPLIAAGYAVVYLLYAYVYTKSFPRISKYLGYGELKDEE